MHIRSRSRFLSGFLALVVTTPTHATEGGGSNYLPGFYGDLGMAALPDQGTVFINFLAGYADPHGSAGTLLEMPGFLRATSLKLLGGHFVFGAFPGVMGTYDHSGSHDRHQIALADFYFVPFAVHWNLGFASILAFEGVVAPTGLYERNGLNTGRNVWSFDHNVMMTWSLPGNNELSMNLGYMNNTVNTSTRYETGDEFHFDYTVGHYPRPDLGLGVTGSYYRQVTSDDAPVGLAGVPLSEASTIGPVIMYTPKIGGKDVTFSLKWLYEFDVTGRAENQYLILRTVLAFD